MWQKLSKSVSKLTWVNIKYLSSGSLIGDDPADDRYEAWYDGTGEPLLLGEEDGDLEYKGDIPKVKVVERLGIICNVKLPSWWLIDPYKYQQKIQLLAM